MITLCIDTSHVFLTLGLLDENKIIASVQKECWKHQSEELFPTLIDLLEKNHLTSDDIGAIVTTIGPGSYTGVRIGLTLAKVMCSSKNLPLYTLGTLQLYAGLKHCRVLLDARGQRVYTGVYQDGKCLEEPHIMMLDDLKADDVDLVGDLRLVKKEDVFGDIVQNFVDLKPFWQLASNPNTVAPEYLKPSESYLVK